jgi:hypothetical protein
MPNAALTEGCPHFRFLSGHTYRIIRAFITSTSERHRAIAMIEAADLSHLITQVIEPLAREARGEQYAAELNRLARSLAVVARQGERLEANFPPDNGRQLLFDRLDGIEVLLRQVLQRRLSRNRCAKILPADRRAA